MQGLTPALRQNACQKCGQLWKAGSRPTPPRRQSVAKTAIALHHPGDFKGRESGVDWNGWPKSLERWLNSLDEGTRAVVVLSAVIAAVAIYTVLTDKGPVASTLRWLISVVGRLVGWFLRSLSHHMRLGRVVAWIAARVPIRSPQGSVVPEDREVLTSADLRRAVHTGLITSDEERFLNGVIGDMGWVEFRLVELFDDPKAWAARYRTSYPKRPTVHPYELLESAMPTLRSQGRIYEHSVRRLQDKALIGNVGLHKLMAIEDALQSSTSPLGAALARVLRTRPASAV